MRSVAEIIETDLKGEGIVIALNTLGKELVNAHCENRIRSKLALSITDENGTGVVVVMVNGDTIAEPMKIADQASDILEQARMFATTLLRFKMC